MGRYRKKPVEITAISFEEIVEYGRQVAPENAAQNGGFAWHFDYEGHPITHERNDCYLIPTLEGTMKFEPGSMLITGVNGEIYPCRNDIFRATYEKVD